MSQLSNGLSHRRDGWMTSRSLVRSFVLTIVSFCLFAFHETESRCESGLGFGGSAQCENVSRYTRAALILIRAHLLAHGWRGQQNDNNNNAPMRLQSCNLIFHLGPLKLI